MLHLLSRLVLLGTSVTVLCCHLSDWQHSQSPKYSIVVIAFYTPCRSYQASKNDLSYRLRAQLVNP